jgi:hypothetical protein
LEGADFLDCSQPAAIFHSAPHPVNNCGLLRLCNAFTPETQAIFFRRRHQPRRPAPAKIKARHALQFAIAKT